MLYKYLRFQRDPNPTDGGGIAEVMKEVKGLKVEAEKANEALKKATADNELLKKANEEWTKKFEQQTQDIKTVNEYVAKMEEDLKQKKVTPAQQLKFVDLLGKAIEDNWDDIQKYKSSQKGRRLTIKVIPEDTKAAADMGITTNVVDAGAYFTTVQVGIRALPNRKVHMRDIIPLGTMSTGSLTYMRETGGEGDLAPWAENSGAKQQFDRDFIEITVPAEYIAGWLRVSRKMLDDMAAFRSYLQMRLMEMYLKVEDSQILNGNGVSPQLEGLLEVAVAATRTTGANIERLVFAISQLESSDYTATGIVVHVAAYYNIALNKAEGSGEYDLPGIVVIQNGQLFVAGVPVYKTTAMPVSTYLVGDFVLGCQLFIREQPAVEFFDQDANNVTTNMITVRIEGRVALAIYRAEAFVQGQFEGVTT
jgi:HK97 family phage major capsid protein